MQPRCLTLYGRVHFSIYFPSCRLQRRPQCWRTLHGARDQPGRVPFPRPACPPDAAAQAHQRARALLPAHGAVPAAACDRATRQPAGTCQYTPPSSFSFCHQNIPRSASIACTFQSTLFIKHHLNKHKGYHSPVH